MATVRITFCIYGDAPLNTVAIAELIRKTPSISWKKGDPIRNYNSNFRRDSGCTYSLPDIETEDLEEINEAFLKDFGNIGIQLGNYI